MKNDDIEILNDLLRSYIVDNKIFNRTQIALQIEYDNVNFNKWLKLERTLPVDKLLLLEEFMKKYGFMTIN